jgi:hypothetical protein
MEIVILAIAVLLVVSALAGIYVAQAKKRHEVEGAIFGVLFGPLGVLIEANLPEKTSPAVEDDGHAPHNPRVGTNGH